MHRLLPFVLLAACAEESPRSGLSLTPLTPATSSPDVAQQPAPEPEPEPVARHGFVVSEWGTYTSVMGSDGVPLPGLHLEEEGLPTFVHGRCSEGPVCLSIGDKDLENLPEAVTQKLETPVLFFYSDTPRTVRVKVDFPDGIISQFYPKASAFSPALGELHHVSKGDMTWDVELDPTLSHDRFPWVADDDIWAPSRRVPATPLRVENEHERFIFYRGLGRFTPPVRVTSVGTRATLANDSNDIIPAAFHLTRDTAGRGAWRALGPVSGGASATFDTAVAVADGYLQDARADLLAALETSGLTHEEALSMVDTWEHSYFRSSGSRVLYVAPRAWTDALLPITIEPAPDILVRTLVGRIELFTDADERDLLNRFEAAWANDTRTQALAAAHAELGRFAAPHLARLATLARDHGNPALAAWLGVRHDEACLSRF